MTFEFLSFRAEIFRKFRFFFYPEKLSCALYDTFILEISGPGGVRRRPGLRQRLGGTWIHRDPEAGDPTP